MTLSIIVAMTKNRVIGFNNTMPWHLPADLAWFKKHTLNNPVIMGRRTFESIGRALPNRTNIVISTKPQKNENNLFWVKSINEALFLAKDHEEVFIIGGGNIYKQCISMVDKLYLTHIDTKIDGDTYFPDINLNEWLSIYSQNNQADEKNNFDYKFEILTKIKKS